MYRPFDSCAIFGRYHTYHKGHQSLVNLGLSLCDRVFIFIGSSQEQGTERNPYNIATRIKMFKTIYDGYTNISIHAVPDLTNENDISVEWGKYVLDNFERYLHKAPEVMIYGDDRRASNWFDPEDIKDTCEFIVPRSRIPISGTMLRDLMILDKRKEWMTWVDPKLHKIYDELRAELMTINYYIEREKELRAS